MSTRMQEQQEQQISGLQENVRSLREQLAERTGEVRGAVMVGAEISKRSVDLDRALTASEQRTQRVVQDASALVRAIAELVVSVEEGRDVQATVDLMVETLTGQGINVLGPIQFERNSRGWQAALTGPAPVSPVSTSPVMASIHAAEDRIQAEAEHARADAQATAHAQDAAAAMAPAAR